MDQQNSTDGDIFGRTSVDADQVERRSDGSPRDAVEFMDGFIASVALLAVIIGAPLLAFALVRS